MSEIINIHNGWEETTLGEVADIGSSKRIFFSDYVSEGIPFYRSKEIIEKQQLFSVNNSYSNLLRNLN